MKNINDKVKQILEDDKLPAYTWPGLYPMYYIDNGGNILCPNCANENDDFSEVLIDYGVNWETPNVYCDHCGSIIEAAYIDD